MIVRRIEHQYTNLKTTTLFVITKKISQICHMNKNVNPFAAAELSENASVVSSLNKVKHREHLRLYFHVYKRIPSDLPIPLTTNKSALSEFCGNSSMVLLYEVKLGAGVPW